MNTIKEYLETLFINLPKTTQVTQLKEDLSASMEDKYEELKEEGKSENEAIGTVIAEFGNIDELLEELDVPYSKEEENEEILVVAKEDALNYIADKKKIGLQVGIGVVFCCLGVGIFQGVMAIAMGRESIEVLGMIPLLLFGAIGVVCFILAGYRNKRYEKMNHDFVLTDSTRKLIETMKKDYERSHILSIIIGVVLCIISLLPVFVVQSAWEWSEMYELMSMGMLVSIAGAGSLFFIYTGNISIAFTNLLKNGKKKQSSKKEIKKKKSAIRF